MACQSRWSICTENETDQHQKALDLYMLINQMQSDIYLDDQYHHLRSSLPTMTKTIISWLFFLIIPNRPKWYGGAYAQICNNRNRRSRQIAPWQRCNRISGRNLPVRRRYLRSQLEQMGENFRRSEKFTNIWSMEIRVNISDARKNSPTVDRWRSVWTFPTVGKIHQKR